LRSPFHARADQSVLHHPGIQECPDELQQPLVLDAFGDLAHQFVMIDSIEELFQIKINHPAVACSNILLRLSHRMMCGSTRSKPIAVLGKRRVPSPLQNLHHRLLDEAIQHGWHGQAKLHFGPVSLWDWLR
jgi:site-specific DNA recombinase